MTKKDLNPDQKLRLMQMALDLNYDLKFATTAEKQQAVNTTYKELLKTL
jgi:hypothetical protein